MRSEVQDLVVLNGEWSDSYLQRDAATFNRILADDFVSTGPKGTRRDKSQYIGFVTRGDCRWEAVHTDDLQVSIYGDTAVVTGSTSSEGQYKGQDSAGVYRFTRVYIRRQGNWRAVAAHATQIEYQ